MNRVKGASLKRDSDKDSIVSNNNSRLNNPNPGWKIYGKSKIHLQNYTILKANEKANELGMGSGCGGW